MKNLKNLLAILIIILTAACSKDDGASPTILKANTINPNTGPKNTVVTIKGTGFSDIAINNSVTLNGKTCAVINSSATQLTIAIPPGAGSGNLKVSIGTSSVETTNFDFIVTATVTTIAGGARGFTDGQGTIAKFNFPNGITCDAEGNLFVADFGNTKIRKISPKGLVTTFAGSTEGRKDGQGILAQILFPTGIVVDPSGNLFVSESVSAVRKISNTSFVETHTGFSQGYEDGPRIFSKFNRPTGMAIDAEGNLFVLDSGNHKIRKISSFGEVTTFAGSTEGFIDGQGTNAKLSTPFGVAIDPSGNLFICELGTDKIRKISPTGLVTTIAGSTRGYADGPVATAKFFNIKGIAVDAIGNLYITDSQNNKIRKISTTGIVTTIAGSTRGSLDGVGLNAQFNFPNGIAIDKQGNLYVTDNNDTGTDLIRKITFD